jgi:hypothetical protein
MAEQLKKRKTLPKHEKKKKISGTRNYLGEIHNIRRQLQKGV